MTMNQVSLTTEDFDKEFATTSYNIGPITALNIIALRAAVDDLKDAQIALILGHIRRLTYSDVFGFEYAAVDDKQAQRETKWLVVYEDITDYFDVGNTIANAGFSQRYRVEIPTANLDLLPDSRTDELDITAGDAATYVTAFEAIVKSPTGGATRVVEIRHVGRST